MDGLMKDNETLYSLSQAMRTAIDGGFVVDSETGEIFWSPDDLDALEIALAEKAEAVIAVQREYASKADMVDAEIKRLQALKKSYAGQAERLKGYMKACVVANDGKAIETPIARISLRKSDRLEILDPSAIPEDYMSYKDPEPDKMLIKKAIKSGTPVPGCAIVENQNLQIR